MATNIESYKFTRPIDLSPDLPPGTKPLLSQPDSDDTPPPPALPPWPARLDTAQGASKALSAASSDDFRPRRLSAVLAERRALERMQAHLPPPSIAPSDGKPLPPQEPFPYILPEIQKGRSSLHRSDKALIHLLDHSDVLHHLNVLIHCMSDRDWNPNFYSTLKHKGTSKDVLQTIGEILTLHSKNEETNDFIEHFRLACDDKREPSTCFRLLKQLAPRKNRYPEHVSFEDLIYKRFCKRNRFSKDRIDIGLLTHYFNEEEDSFFSEPASFPGFTPQTADDDDDSSVYDLIPSDGELTFRSRNASVIKKALQLPSVPKVAEEDQVDLMDPAFARLRKAVVYYSEIEPIVSHLKQPGAIQAAKITIKHPAIEKLLHAPALQTNPVVQYLVILAKKDNPTPYRAEGPNAEDLEIAIETARNSLQLQSDSVAQYLLNLADKSNLIIRTAQAAIVGANVRTIVNSDNSFFLLEHRADLLNDPLVQRLIAKLAERIRASNSGSSSAAAAAALPASVMDLTLVPPERADSSLSERNAPNLSPRKLTPEAQPSEEEKRDEERISLLGSQHPSMRRRFSLQSDDGLNLRPAAGSIYASPRSVFSNGSTLRHNLRGLLPTYPELPEARNQKFSLHPAEKAFTNLLDNPDTMRLINRLKEIYKEDLSATDLAGRKTVYNRIRLHLKLYEKRSSIDPFIENLATFCNHRNINPLEILQTLSLLSERTHVHRVNLKDKNGWKHFIKNYFCGLGDRINLTLLKNAFTPLEPVRKENPPVIDEAGSIITLKTRPLRAGSLERVSSLTQLFRFPSAEFNGLKTPLHLYHTPASSSSAAAAAAGIRGRGISQESLATIQRIVEEGRLESRSSAE